jgi:hypothetical protein
MFIPNCPKLIYVSIDDFYLFHNPIPPFIILRLTPDYSPEDFKGGYQGLIDLALGVSFFYHLTSSVRCGLIFVIRHRIVTTSEVMAKIFAPILQSPVQSIKAIDPVSRVVIHGYIALFG